MVDIDNEENGLILQINTQTLPSIQNTEFNYTKEDTKEDTNIITNNIRERRNKTIKHIQKTTNGIITYSFFKEYIFPITSKCSNEESKSKSKNKNKNKGVFIYKHQIKNTLLKLKIKFNKNDKKDILETLLFNIYNSIIDKDNSVDIRKINLIKSEWKTYIKTKKAAIYGPGFLDKIKCKNAEDCFSMESINDTPSIYFFSIKDNHGSIFFFDIRTFDKLIKTQSSNPYTREPFNDSAITLYETRKTHMESNNISIFYQEELDYINNLTPDQRIHNRIFDIFQIIDELNVMAGGTKLSWFKNLEIYQLKKYYKVLEDIWMYRANLSDEQKKEIVPDNELFTFSVKYVFKLTNKIKIKNIILNEMEKLVKSSSNINHRNTGAYYVLIAFTEVSIECANDMPWLIQY